MMKQVMYQIERGIPHPPQFCAAIDVLQNLGYVTELWVDMKCSTVTLRWVRKGSKWHVQRRGLKNFYVQIEDIGQSVAQWVNARSSGSGHEGHFAVAER